jgi:hypothetical protein
MSCRRVLSSTPLLVRSSETGGDGGTMISDTTLEENALDVSPPRSVTGIFLLCFYFEGEYRFRTQARRPAILNADFLGIPHYLKKEC